MPLSRFALLVLPALLVAHATPADDFAASLKLAPGSYQPASSSALLGVPLAPAALRLTDLSRVQADYFKASFVTLPNTFGLTCQGQQEVDLLPSSGQNSAALLRQTRLQPLYQSAQITVLRGPGPTFATLSYNAGTQYLSVCQAVSTPKTARTFSAPGGSFLGSVPYLLMADRQGALAWCSGANPGSALHRLQAFSGDATALAVSNDGQVIAGAGWDATPVLKLWDSAAEPLRTIALPAGPVSLALSFDGKTAVVLDANRNYSAYDTASGAVLKRWTVPSLLVTPLIGGPGPLFVEFLKGLPLRVYDIRLGRSVLSTRNIDLSGVSFTADGAWLVTADTHGVLHSFSTKDWQEGPSVSLGVVAGPTLHPGASGPTVIATLGNTPTGGAEQEALRGWTVGDPGVHLLTTVPRPAGSAVVIHRPDATLGFVMGCLGQQP